MTSLQLDNKITTGNIATIAVILVTAGIAWGNLSNAVEMQATRTDAIEALIASRTNARDQQIAGHEARLRAMEISSASQSTDLRNIQIGISEIKAQLDRMQQREVKR